MNKELIKKIFKAKKEFHKNMINLSFEEKLSALNRMRALVKIVKKEHYNKNDGK